MLQVTSKFRENPIPTHLGQLVFKQYIPLKRVRFGIKIIILCEQSGYTYRFHIYAGKEDPAFQLQQYIQDDAAHLK